ncbi:MAG TPA: cytochrome P450 [Acidimicrobiales bacterium]|jgi:cytochrome P450 family 142 subfamily A polypeptide 1
MTMTEAPNIELMAGTFYAGNPFPAFAWMRQHAPAYYDEAGEVWGISRYADVRAIGQDPQSFSSQQGSRPNTPLPYMIDMDAPEHRRRRRLVSAGFTPEAVRIRQPRVRQVCDEILDAVCEKGTCDLVTDIAAPLPLVMIADMLGFPSDDWSRLLEWSETMLMSQGSPDPDAFVRAATAFSEWEAYVRDQIAQRRAQGTTDDLLGALAHGEIDGDRLDDTTLVYEALLILIGGDETSRHVISGGMEALLRHPDQLAALKADGDLLPGAIEEMLRWVTPIKNMNRNATRDVELHGQTIKAGQNVLLLYPSANRDESVFADPETFDIRRSPNDHVAFGFGAHLCLGHRLARAELLGMVDRLVDRFDDLAIDTDDPLALRASNFIVGYESIPVRFTPTAPIAG